MSTVKPSKPDAPALLLDTVLQGDCVENLDKLPEKSIDLIFADPPYNLQLEQELWRPNMTKVDAVDDDWDRFKSFADYDGFTERWLKACRRVLKDTGTIWVIGSYHNIYRVGAILMNLEYWILNDIVWVKTNPMPNFRGVRFTNAHETLIWAQKIRGARYTFHHHPMKSLNDGLQMRSDWHLALCTGAERIKENGAKAHATQKPEALLYRVILSSSNPGDVVLDPFLGSGTTAAVARKLHRHWLGIERDPGYVEVAKARIEAVQPEMFMTNVFDFGGKRKLRRVAFASLLESGLVRPGQVLYFGRRGEHRAVVLADGRIQHAEAVGSIHEVGSAIQRAPCNGWDHWYYEDEGGARAPVDNLRKAFREANSVLDANIGTENPS